MKLMWTHLVKLAYKQVKLVYKLSKSLTQHTLILKIKLNIYFKSLIIIYTVRLSFNYKTIIYMTFKIIIIKINKLIIWLNNGVKYF